MFKFRFMISKRILGTLSLFVYLMILFRRTNETKCIYGADCVIIEGIFLLYDAEIRKNLDIQLFVDTEDDIRLARRCNYIFFPISLSLQLTIQ